MVEQAHIIKNSGMRNDLSGFRRRFYSDLIYRSLSRHCMKTLEESMGRFDIGFFFIKIADIFDMIGEFGPEAGFRIIESFRNETEKVFGQSFGDDVLFIEQIDVNGCLVCLRIREQFARDLENRYADAVSRISGKLNLKLPESTENKARLLTGWSEIGSEPSGSFYENVFTAFCDARRSVAGNGPSIPSDVRDRFSEILRKSSLECLYQPIVSLETGEIAGWESFVRGPENSGFHLPGDLFRFAGEIRKTYALDRECRKAAIRNFGIAEKDRMLFMNIHMQSLNDPEFTAGLTREQSHEFGMSPENIVLEFSHNHAIRDYSLMLKNLEHYRNQGFKVAIDNFGESTLHFISVVRPDFIKIDANMIRGIGYFRIKQAIVEGIMSVAENTGAKVVATGIETESELRTLASIGIHMGQGYVVAKPAFPKEDKPFIIPGPKTVQDGFDKTKANIGHLVREAPMVKQDTLVSEVKEMLANRTSLCGIIVVEDKVPVGLVMSHQLDKQLGTRYGVSLFYRRPVSFLMDASPLVVQANQPLGEVARAAMNRENDKIYDDIIVVDEQEIIGTVSVQNMMNTLAKIEIRARESAEAATRSKSEFLANMSHDIRTPLNAIMGMAELLWESPLDSDQRKYVDIFRNASESLLDLVNDILDLSKVEAGQIELETVDFDLFELVERTCEVIALNVHEKNVELICHVSGKVPRRVMGDPGRLRQVLSNLIGNASKFTHKGEIAVTVRPAEDGCLEFAVRDTGIGIPKDRQAHVFETFAQAHSSTSRQYGGTGLGLSICKKIVELMNGRIWVESEPGKGSAFCFTVPFEADGFEDDRPDFSGTSVLIADDNRTSRLALAEVVGDWGMEAITVKNRGECMDMLCREESTGKSFQAILLDGRLAETDGFDVAERIREQFGLHRRIVMMVASDRISDSFNKTRALGLACHVAKPLRRDALKDALDTALGRRVRAEDDWLAEASAKFEDMPPLRILLAEDNENNRKLFSFYLKGTSHKVDFAENGRICFDKYAFGEHDIVFMDINMPIMDGYKTTMAIRKWEREKNREPVPIIALTAHAIRGKKQESLDAGCTDHMTKPFKKSELFSFLKHYSKPKDEDSGPSKDETDIDCPVSPVPVENKSIVRVDPEIKVLIPDFLRVTQREIGELKTGISDENHTIIERLGHRIKGACLCYGFDVMAGLAEKIELAGESDKDIETIRKLAGELETYFENIEVE